MPSAPRHCCSLTVLMQLSEPPEAGMCSRGTPEVPWKGLLALSSRLAPASIEYQQLSKAQHQPPHAADLPLELGLAFNPCF